MENASNEAGGSDQSGASPDGPLDPSQTQQDQDPRQTAVNQAAEVLDSLQGGEVFLNGFNLLQVIANPRGNPHDLTFSAHGRYGGGGLTPSKHGPASSRHGRNSLHGRNLFSPQAFSSADPQSTQQSSSTTDNNSSSTEMLTEAYYQLESTLMHVTEQVDGLNHVLEEWSRKILDEDPYADTDDLPEAQLREYPADLQTATSSMSELKEYLAKCGILAHKFRELEGVHQQLDQDRVETHETSNSQQEELMESTAAAESVALLKEEVPEIFWHEMNDMDLTNPETFQDIFFTEHRDLSDEPATSDETGNEVTVDSTSIHTWFPLVPPDSLNHCLDKVEMALLEAVREQSSAFFEESIRFATLQEWIELLLQEVISLQAKVDSLIRDSVTPMRIVPADHSQKQEWNSVIELLDSASELIRCKASIAGYLSAADDLTALDQVYYGRQKLKQNNLAQLQALQGVAKQLDQYETLIVTNLREELVESFLDWNSDSTGANSGGQSSSPTYALSRSTTSGGGQGHSVQNLSRVRDIVQALTKCHGLKLTVQAYNTRLHDVMRLIVRTVVAEFADSAPSGASGMALDRFLDCLDMTMEQLLALLTSASDVAAFCTIEGFSFREENASEEPFASGTSPLVAVVTAAAELSSKSISELLRLRKDAHSLLSLEEMKRLWDKCMAFVSSLEEVTGYKASALRSTMLSQAKAFIERQHDSNMSAMVAALESERWAQCEVSTQRQAALTRLCTGRKLIPGLADHGNEAAVEEKQQEVEVNGVHYKVVWSCLLLVEMVIGNLAASSQFTGTSSSIVGKVADLLRLFNSRTTQLVLGAKAIHSAARLKSINAKHLSLVTQCLGMVISILPNIRASLMAHLPTKQHRLLNDMDQIKKEYAEHNEKVLNKFVTIIGGIIEHHLAPKIPGTNFDARAKEHPPSDDGAVSCCVFLEGISSNTRKMHQVLFSLLPPVHLQDVFSRIFAYVDTKIPSLFTSFSLEVTSQPGNTPQKMPTRFEYPQTPEGKKRMLLEAETLTRKLNGLQGVQPWEFSLVGILERRLEFSLSGKPEQDSEAETDVTTIPSDTEDSPDRSQDIQNGAPVASKRETEEDIPARETNEAQSTKVIEDSGEDKEEKNESTIDYPAEVTAL
mmetsp:Transcript_12199/g.33853  ORF Transcript_12199/g.33853 Transcript_12199/m.33853 type:complete len:1132 (+) Transcript_12199:133-3528(+)